MLYFDTNFLVPLFHPEPNSARVGRFISGLTEDSMAISEWTRVEFASVFGRLVRMGDVDQRGAAAADLQFDAVIARSFQVLPLVAADYGLARRFLGHYAAGLRAGDALHLAIAANHGAARMFTLDRRLVAAGLSLGLPVSSGIEL